MSDIPTVLKKIVQRKIEEIAERSDHKSIADLEKSIALALDSDQAPEH